MNSLFIFFIQSAVALLLFYLIYWFFLRKETYYNANRFFLLFAILVSTLMPLFPIHYNVFVDGGISQTNAFVDISKALKGIQPYEGSGFNTGFSLSIMEASLITYLTGVVIFMLRLLIQTGILILLLIKNKTKSIQGLRIVESEKYGIPFSFFNFVYINPKFHNKDVLPEILAHEKVHIREKHWVDLIIIELLTVILWFNPIIWFFEHSIKLNHEFLADRGVISKGNHIGKYQALLVNQLMGMQIIRLTNNLNYSINSNRLKMMTKQKTNKIKTIKLVWALPVIALLLFAFAEPNYQILEEENLITSVENSEPQNVKLYSGKVVDENGDALPGVSIIVGGTSQGTVSDIDGEFKIGLTESSTLVFSFVGMKTLKFSANEIFKKASADKKIEIQMTETAIELNPGMFKHADAPPAPTASPTKPKKIPPPPPPKSVKTKNLTTPPKKVSVEKEFFVVVEEMPKYPGGYSALGDHISKMQQKLAKAKSIKGNAKVSFVIDKNGKATDIHILEKDNDLAGKGAATIVFSMEKWSPGTQRGKAVPVSYILPVKF
jgi:hypothetical protein